MKKLYFIATCCLALFLVNCSDNKENPASKTSGNENGHEWVDLGLPSGTRWATCNIGATYPQESGNFYSWGEIEEKAVYDWDSYKYGRLNALTKYCTNTEYGLNGFQDYKKVLDFLDDAALMNWGGLWRMPTKTQLKELMSECYWVWTNDYDNSGVAGFIVYKVKSEADKNVKIYDGGTPSDSYSLFDVHIFLPAAGYRMDGEIKRANERAFYWTSSLSTSSCDNPLSAWQLIFLSDAVTCQSDFRYYGQSVRAVIPGE